MATLQLVTSNEGENDNAYEFDFNKWINDNKLNAVKNLLIKHKMNTVKTLRVTSNEFNKLMADPELYQYSQVVPLLFPALKKVPNDNDDDNKSQQKVVHIILSEEEEKATKKLDEHNIKLTNLIKQINEKTDELTKNTKKCEDEINSSFNNLQQQIQNEKKNIMNELINIETTKKSEIDRKASKLNELQRNTKNAIKSCNTLIHDAQMDRNKRKKQILSISNDITNKVPSNDAAHIDTNISFTFNHKNTSSFLSSLCSIAAQELHPIPVISHAEAKSITNTTATVHWNASLSKEDVNKDVTSTLFMKVECENINIELDEKEKDLINSRSSLVPFTKNEKDYYYKLTLLQENKNYNITINIYESINNDNKETKKRSDHEPISVNFKTLSNDEKEYKYQSDFDENGICYAIGSNFGQKQWSNPADQGLINVNSLGWEHGDINEMVGRTEDVQCHTNDKQNMWITISFGEYKVKPTAYSLRNGTAGSHYLRHWKLEGSNDGNNWTVIKNYTDDTKMNESYGICTWDISECNQYYNAFKILQTGHNSSSNNHVVVSGFEVYGYLRNN